MSLKAAGHRDHKRVSGGMEEGDEPYYPMNDEKNEALFARYRELAEKEGNVLFGGRLGQYKYYDMDKVIEAAWKMCAEEA